MFRMERLANDFRLAIADNLPSLEPDVADKLPMLCDVDLRGSDAEGEAIDDGAEDATDHFDYDLHLEECMFGPTDDDDDPDDDLLDELGALAMEPPPATPLAAAAAASPPALPESTRDLVPNNKCGCFTFSLKPSAGTHGSIQASCPIPPLSSGTGCKTTVQIFCVLPKDDDECMLKLVCWCSRYRHFTRQRTHRRDDFVAVDVPSLRRLQELCPHDKPDKKTIETDAELDAADAAGGVAIAGMVEDHAEEDLFGERVAFHAHRFRWTVFPV